MARSMCGGRWWLFCGAAVVVLMVSVSWAADPSTRLGFVDLQLVISQSKEGQAAMNTVKAEAAEKQKEISAKEAEIKQMDADLQKQASALSDAAKKDREEEIRRKLRDLKRVTEDFNRDLAKRESEMVNDLLRDLTVVIRDYGKEKGFTLIVEKGQSGVIYGNDAADLTKEILERYNTRRTKK
ncbi:OmpH family outer membrane protein [Candidatus Methylomirabilis sp.]|uniref:OmpH family outer membrane protein n=1 Tax=Candidatus Methylomirabilis sp. TaxID=2032687 RepID=UPI002A61854E|nr:OmpH family outer membrane protein [Candidatus Methylomirabilis sp.]